MHTSKFILSKTHNVNSKIKPRNQSQIITTNLGLKKFDYNHLARMKSVIVNASDGGAEAETAALVVEKPKSRQFQAFEGFPAPFGATARDGGVNLAVFSSNAMSATLCLTSLSDLQEKRVIEQISLDPLTNRSGDVWHVLLKGDFEDMLYGYKFDGKFSPEEGHYYDPSQILLDLCGKAVLSRGEFGVLEPEVDCWPQMACMVPSANKEFNWEGDLLLKFQQRDLVIYEMHVCGFTRHDSSRTDFLGTYVGVADKLDHLKELGVNCIELMPCQEFNELEYNSYNSVLGDYKMNFWGYSTVNFFPPMIRYSSAGNGDCGHGAIDEFKLLVREAHKREIEVIMDVVFNHTAEGNDKDPTLSFRGVDNNVFYMLAPKGRVL